MNLPSTRRDLQAAFAHLRRLVDTSAIASFDDVIVHLRSAMEVYGKVGPVVSPDAPTRSVTIAGRPAEWLVAHDFDPDRRLLHVHGGGLITGSLASHRTMLSELARRSGWSVLSVDYRLAPENQFPAAHDDVAAAYAYMLRNGPSSPGDARSVAISADSSGAVLGLTAFAGAIETGARAPNALVLFGPCLDLVGHECRPNRETDPVVSQDAVAALGLYAGDLPLTDPRLSTLRLPDAVLANAPPCLIQVSSTEYLLPDAQAMAARLTSLDRQVRLSLWPNMPHVWHQFLDLLPEANEALAEAGEFLRGILPD